MNQPYPYHIFPLGDSALTIDFGNRIDVDINKEVFRRFRQFKEQPLPGMVEVVPAYCSVTIYYHIGDIKKNVPGNTTAFEWMKKQAEEKLNQPASAYMEESTLVKVPVCYDDEFGTDLTAISSKKNISKEEIIRLHSERPYRIYMLGFLPGFPYMGEINERIIMPRKNQPQQVAAGSVGIAGKQTGIYPFVSPGGWQIIGRTPLKIFDFHQDEPVLLKAGDTVQFYPIDKHEFANY